MTKEEKTKTETPKKESKVIKKPKKEQVKDKVAHVAKIRSNDLPISRKHSVEISSFIRNRKLTQAKSLLNLALKKKVAIPFKRYNRDVGHKKGIAAGRYPEKAITNFIMLLNSLETNAEFKGLDTKNLFITKVSASKGTSTWHYGRKRRRKAKRTNVVMEAMEKIQK